MTSKNMSSSNFTNSKSSTTTKGASNTPTKSTQSSHTSSTSSEILQLTSNNPDRQSSQKMMNSMLSSRVSTTPTTTATGFKSSIPSYTTSRSVKSVDPSASKPLTMNRTNMNPTIDKIDANSITKPKLVITTLTASPTSSAPGTPRSTASSAAIAKAFMVSKSGNSSPRRISIDDDNSSQLSSLGSLDQLETVPPVVSTPPAVLTPIIAKNTPTTASTMKNLSQLTPSERKLMLSSDKTKSQVSGSVVESAVASKLGSKQTSKIDSKTGMTGSITSSVLGSTRKVSSIKENEVIAQKYREEAKSRKQAMELETLKVVDQLASTTSTNSASTNASSISPTKSNRLQAKSKQLEVLPQGSLYAVGVEIDKVLSNDSMSDNSAIYSISSPTSLSSISSQSIQDHSNNNNNTNMNPMSPKSPVVPVLNLSSPVSNTLDASKASYILTMSSTKISSVEKNREISHIFKQQAALKLEETNRRIIQDIALAEAIDKKSLTMSTKLSSSSSISSSISSVSSVSSHSIKSTNIPTLKSSTKSLTKFSTKSPIGLSNTALNIGKSDLFVDTSLDPIIARPESPKDDLSRKKISVVEQNKLIAQKYREAAAIKLEERGKKLDEEVARRQAEIRSRRESMTNFSDISSLSDDISLSESYGGGADSILSSIPSRRISSITQNKQIANSYREAAKVKMKTETEDTLSTKKSASGQNTNTTSSSSKAMATIKTNGKTPMSQSLKAALGLKPSSATSTTVSSVNGMKVYGLRSPNTSPVKKSFKLSDIQSPITNNESLASPVDSLEGSDNDELVTPSITDTTILSSQEETHKDISGKGSRSTTPMKKSSIEQNKGIVKQFKEIAEAKMQEAIILAMKKRKIAETKAREARSLVSASISSSSRSISPRPASSRDTSPRPMASNNSNDNANDSTSTSNKDSSIRAISPRALSSKRGIITEANIKIAMTSSSSSSSSLVAPAPAIESQASSQSNSRSTSPRLHKFENDQISTISSLSMSTPQPSSRPVSRSQSIQKQQQQNQQQLSSNSSSSLSSLSRAINPRAMSPRGSTSIWNESMRPLPARSYTPKAKPRSYLIVPKGQLLAVPESVLIGSMSNSTADSVTGTGTSTGIDSSVSLVDGSISDLTFTIVSSNKNSINSSQHPSSRSSSPRKFPISKVTNPKPMTSIEENKKIVKDLKFQAKIQVNKWFASEVSVGRAEGPIVDELIENIATSLSEIIYTRKSVRFTIDSIVSKIVYKDMIERMRIEKEISVYADRAVMLLENELFYPLVYDDLLHIAKEQRQNTILQDIGQVIRLLTNRVIDETINESIELYAIDHHNHMNAVWNNATNITEEYLFNELFDIIIETQVQTKLRAIEETLYETEIRKAASIVIEQQKQALQNLRKKAEETRIERMHNRNSNKPSRVATDKDKTEFLKAAKNGDIIPIRRLLDTKDVDIDGWIDTHHRFNALTFASMYGHYDIVKLLLQEGAIVISADNNEITPLLMASHYGYTNITKLLLDYGADANYRAWNHGTTPLLLACKAARLPPNKGKNHDHEGVVKLLLKRGADPNLPNIRDKNRTPLMEAIRYNEIDIVRALLHGGADISRIDVNSQDALMHATNSNRTDIVQLLQQMIRV